MDGGKFRHESMQFSGKKQDLWESPVPEPVRSLQEPWNLRARGGYSRDRQASWDAREMRTATTKVRREVYEDFRQMCRARKKTPYSVLQDLLLTWMYKERQLEALQRQ